MAEECNEISDPCNYGEHHKCKGTFVCPDGWSQHEHCYCQCHSKNL